jgi:hypothetical protein
MEAPTPRETATYVWDHARELARIAKAAKLDILAFVLEMARLEAEIQVTREPANSKSLSQPATE